MVVPIGFCGMGHLYLPLWLALTLMLTSLVAASLAPVAEVVLLSRLLEFGVVGLAVGGFLDAIGLASAVGVDGSDSRSLIKDAPNGSTSTAHREGV